jgi:hypothetical protein
MDELMDLAIIPECFLDTILIETIVPPLVKDYNHKSGWPDVVKTMRENFREKFAVGIIDKDKRTTPYIKEFKMILQFKEDLELYAHTTKPHYIIYIRPAMEKWIIKCADEVGVDIGGFGLDKNVKELKKRVDNQSEKDEKFKSLFKELKSRNASAVIMLSKWVEYLRDHNYQADMETLKQL